MNLREQLGLCQPKQVNKDREAPSVEYL
jgi:hypothetical protein